MKTHILKEQWTALPSDQRIALRKKYDLRITESTEVINDRVISDGVSLESLSAVFNIERMRQELPHVREDATCDELWTSLLGVNVNETVSANLPTPTEPKPEKVEAPKKRRTKKTQ
jgi:hypothetical protein